MADGPGVALVTGASAGIGRACADRLAGGGWRVTGASRRGTGTAGPGSSAASSSALGNSAQGNNAPGNSAAQAGQWTGLVMDVNEDQAVRSGVASIVEREGRLDAVVAAAGWGLAGAVEYTTIAEAKAQFETNFWGCIRVAQAALPLMRAQGSGRIVLISSIGGVIGVPFQAYYSASKFALEGLAEAMAYEVAPFGVHVTLVQPGNIATDFTARRVLADGAAGDSVYAAAMTKAVTAMERDEANGAPADLVAATVARVLEASRPPRRVSVGKASERAGLVAKRLLPFRVFEAAARGSLGVG